MIEASAPAKVILFGEHAAVYGQPAIAAPVSSLRAYAAVEANPPGVSGLHIEAPDLNQRLPVDIRAESVDNALTLTAQLVLKALRAEPPDATITLRSRIPIASGLGSGSAVSTALARALCRAVARALDDAALNRLIYEVEKIHHGTPSGIDNTVIVYERPVYFVRDQTLETLSIGAPLTLLIGDTGIGASTKIAVGDVRALYETQRAPTEAAIRAVGQISEQARAAIEGGDLIAVGGLMNRNHDLLRQLTVSSPELDQLIDAAREAGALGAKLSGGGRGGNMIALVTPEMSDQVERALLAAGATRVFKTTVAQGDS
jgi:mevalonate kinase